MGIIPISQPGVLAQGDHATESTSHGRAPRETDVVRMVIMTRAAASAEVRTVIVGAGPGAMSVVLALQCRGLDDVPLVLDPSGGWLVRWRERFAAQGIPNLRSPAVHHPHPDAFALLGRAEDGELVRSGGVHLPTTGLFDRFTDELIEDHRLAGLVRPDSAERLEVDRDGRPTVVTMGGDVIRADRVVIATDRRVATRIDLDRDLDRRRVAGIDRADVRTVRAGEHIAVVGGGLSAVHLALGAARRGAFVTLVARRSLEVRRFDTHPSWLGPARRREFESLADPAVRRRAIINARRGGTVPHRFRKELAELEVSGEVRCIERVELVGCVDHRDGVRLELRSRGSHVPPDLGAFDRVWLATGGSIDVLSDPLCAPLAAGSRTAVVGGLPDLEADLCCPGTRVHLLGASAGLVLGPTAGNLVGLRRGAQRIAATMAGEDPARADCSVTGAGACFVATPPGRTRSERRVAGRPAAAPAREQAGRSAQRAERLRRREQHPRG